MTLKARITEDMKTAMRAKDTARLSTIRLLLAAIKQREVDERNELADADVLAVIEKMVKQRRDSIAQFRRATAWTSSPTSRRELDVLQAYMPQPLSEAEIDAVIAAAIAATGAAGACAAWARSWRSSSRKLAGRADMGAVSARVKAQAAPADRRHAPVGGALHWREHLRPYRPRTPGCL